MTDTGPISNPDRQPLFPLKLSDFEYYMFADDRPSHPMVFAMTVAVAGELRRKELTLAINDSIRDNPLLACLIADTADQGWSWVPLESHTPAVEWNHFAQTEDFSEVSARIIDLTQSAGLEVQVDATPNAARIVFHLHHACCDGIGALQFIGEVMARYGCFTAGPDDKRPQFVPRNIEQLRLRNQFSSAGTQRSRIGRISRAVAKVSRLLLRRPVTLMKVSNVSDAANQHDRATAGILRFAELPSEFTRGLSIAAQKQKVSVNDLCILEMLLLIHDWRESQGDLSGRSWLRVAVPLSMRSKEHEAMPAANLVSYAFVTRRASECRDPNQLIASIHEQTGDLLFMREGIVALKCLRFFRSVPLGMKMFLELKSCFCTVVLANVGTIRRRFEGRFPTEDGLWKAGNVRITSINGAAPVRRNTHVAVSIGDYGGMLRINLRADNHVMTPEQASQFLSEYVGRLTVVARPHCSDP
ncbi:MAG: hypothetical protein KDA91_04075 [Planctomycetaceae bacterium]|nr:hypothetical protein [Planctomycetaceae bacterium]